MQRRFPTLSLSSYGVGWSAQRRIAIVALVITVVLAIAATVAWLFGRMNGDQDSTPAAPARANSPSSEAAQKPAAGSGSVPGPPHVAEPIAYAKAAAEMLWSYDTRDTSHAQQLAGMQTWMTKEGEYGDWGSVSAQVPDPTLWSRMSDQQQHSTATIAEGHYPAAFKRALADDPSAITEAYIYAVTVTGKQQIVWAGGGQGAETTSITLAVQCRPSQDCSLVAIAPRVAP